MKVLGVSSGMGVSLYPFKKDLIGNVEPRPIFHTPGNVQWKANFGDIPLVRNLGEWDANGNEWPDDLDLIVSSPDCGSGSILRLSVAKKYGTYKNNISLDEFFKAVNSFLPKLFYFENLESLFKIWDETKFKEALENNYRIIKLIAPVSNWGNSQIHRKRLIIIGIRSDLSRKIDKIFKMPHITDQKTCFELYGDLDKLGPKDYIRLAHVREAHDELTTIHSGRKISNAEIFETWNTSLKGKRRWEVTGRKFTTAPGVYRNRKNDYPATARKANRQYDHEGKMLTPRQLARIQGVPDDFHIFIDPDKLNYWINKGRVLVTKTPPMEISYWVLRKMKKLMKLNLI